MSHKTLREAALTASLFGEPRVMKRRRRMDGEAAEEDDGARRGRGADSDDDKDHVGSSSEDDHDGSSDSEDSGDDSGDDSGAGAGAGAGARAGAGAGSGPAAAWSDSDDDDVLVNIANKARLRKLRKSHDEDVVSGRKYTRRLRERFVATQPGTSWAALKPEGGDGGSDADADAVDDAVLRGTDRLLGTAAGLPRDFIDIARQRDGNYADPSKAVVQSTSFHPNGQLLLTAGYDKRLRLFQIDGGKNPRVQSVFFKGTPIRTARFSPDGREVVVAGRRPYFHVYDVVTGKVEKVSGIMGRDEKSLEQFVLSPDGAHMAFYAKDGYVVLVSAVTKQWEGNIKMNGSVRSLAFTPDGNLLAGCDDGMVYLWDVGTRKCITRHRDEGSTSVSAVAVSPDGRHFATGSAMGIVNLYDSKHLKTAPSSSSSSSAASTSLFKPIGAPKPVKAFLNLTSRVDFLEFNHSSEVLAMGCQSVKDALRLAHVPSASVFSNWPTDRTPLHYVSAMAFSPNSGYLVTGNDRGRALLYRLKHFPSA